MEQMIPDQNEDRIPEQVSEVPVRKRKQPKTFMLNLPAFLTEIGKDVRWYYDARLWLPLVLILVALGACMGSNVAEQRTQEKYEAIIQTMEEEALAVEKQAQAQAEATEPAVLPIDPEAEALAVLADSVGNGRSDNVKTIIMWVAVNRSENAIEGHGKPLLEEIAMPHQWQGYDPDFLYSQKTYDIALEVLQTWNSGSLRPLDSDMMWMVLNDDGSVTLRNMFRNNGTKQWREKTVK